MTVADLQASGTGSFRNALRRVPTQARARERVGRVLEAAVGLIEQQGTDHLKMADLAKAAGISIGSLYQYFPDKAAVVHALAERCYQESRHCIEEGLAGIADAAAFREAFAQLYDIYYAQFLAEPAMADIWSGTQGDKDLRAIEIDYSRENAGLLVEAVLRLAPDADRKALAASAFLVMYLGESTMRLAVSVPPTEGRVLVDDYKRMALSLLDAYLPG